MVATADAGAEVAYVDTVATSVAVSLAAVAVTAAVATAAATAAVTVVVATTDGRAAPIGGGSFYALYHNTDNNSNTGEHI